MKKTTIDDKINGLYRKADLFNLNPHGHDRHRSLSKYPSVRIDGIITDDVFDYCDGQFNDNWIWSSPDQTFTNLYFKYPADALVFSLRFSTITS